MSKDMTHFEKVKYFMEIAGQHEQTTDLSSKLAQFRLSLIEEEVGELGDAIRDNDLIEVIDALTDILYVTFGFCRVISVDVHNEERYRMTILDRTFKTRDFSSKFIKLCQNRINRKVDDLKQLIERDDLNKVEEFLVDLLSLTYDFFGVLDVDVDHAFDEVHRSNMSKFCSSLLEAQSTVEEYKKQVPLCYDSPTYEKRGYHWVVFNQSTGKILKSKNWIPPKFILSH